MGIIEDSAKRIVQIASLPEPPDTGNEALNNWLLAAKKYIDVRNDQRSDNLDRGLTVRDIEDGTVVPPGISGEVGTPISDGSGDAGTIAGVTSLSVTHHLFSNYIEWTNPSDSDLWYCELWYSKGSSLISNAKKLAVLTKPTHDFTHSGIDLSSTYYYWVRAYDYNNDYSVWNPLSGGLISQPIRSLSIPEFLDELSGDNYPVWVTTDTYALGSRVQWEVDGVVYNYKSLSDGNLNYDPDTYVGVWWDIVDGTKDTVFTSDRFIVMRQDDPNVAPVPVFVVGQVNGQDAVGVRGDMIIDGTLLARMIATDAIKADAVDANEVMLNSLKSHGYDGGSGFFLDGPNNIWHIRQWSEVVSGAGDAPAAGADVTQSALEAGTTIGAGFLKVTGTGGDITIDGTTGEILNAASGGKGTSSYVSIFNGEIGIYDYYGGAHHLYRAVKKSTTGICVDGETINVGYFRETPSIIISPKNLQSFDTISKDQDQKFVLDAVNPRVVNDEWLFDVECKLELSSNVVSGTAIPEKQHDQEFIPEDRIWNPVTEVYDSNPGYESADTWTAYTTTSSSTGYPVNVRTVSVTVIAKFHMLKVVGGYGTRSGHCEVELELYYSGAWHSTGQTFTYGSSTAYAPITGYSTTQTIIATAASDITGSRLRFKYKWYNLAGWGGLGSGDYCTVEAQAITLTLTAATLSADGTANYLAVDAPQ